MKYALKQVVFDGGRKGKPDKWRSHYITVASGLTWQAAKARRNSDRSLNIVPERGE